MTRVLVLGVTGMLGNTVFRFFADSPGFDVSGSARSERGVQFLRQDLHRRITTGVDAADDDSLQRLFTHTKPDVVINCVGLVKQLAEAEDPLLAIPVNSMLPHCLAQLCKVHGARMIHVSTDCVFSGARGDYREDDLPDATDLYGLSKRLGEVDESHAVTLRTSIIGHELEGAHGLVNWFLSQQGSVKGYRRAVFSGLPTVELARVMRDFVLPNPRLRGLYHVASQPIAKFDLLHLVAREYGKRIEIVAADQPVLDRSLNSSRFNATTHYVAPAWPALVAAMRKFG